MKTFRQFLVEGKGKKVVPPKNKDDGFGFESWEDAIEWYNKLALDDIVGEDVVITTTGEVAWEKGSTRRKEMKRQGKNRYTPEGEARSFETIKDRAKEKLENPLVTFDVVMSDYEVRDFLDLYNVVEKDVHEVAGVDPDEMAEKDYDTYSTMPATIKRRDNRKFSDNDLHNIRAYFNFIQRRMPRGIKLQMMGYATGKTEITFHVMFN